MAVESIFAIIVVGIIAGWLAGLLVAGGGFGLVGDLVVGVVGAFIGGYLIPAASLHIGQGIVAAIIDATIGAVILLVIIKFIQGGFGYNRSRAL